MMISSLLHTHNRVAHIVGNLCAYDFDRTAKRSLLCLARGQRREWVKPSKWMEKTRFDEK